MGWNTIKTPVKARGLGSMTISDHGRAVISLPANILGAWDKAEAFVAQLGDGEHFGKLLIAPAPEGATETFGRAAFATHSLMRIPGWNQSTRTPRDKVTQIAYEIDGPAVIITLPDWARGPAEASEEASAREWTKASSKKKAEKTAAKGEEDQQPASSPTSYDPDKRIFNGGQAVFGHQPNSSHMREADRQTEAVRKLPESKPSQTEPPPSWRGKGDRPEAKITSHNKVNLIGTVLEAGGRAMTLKGVDERKVMEHLVQNMDRRASVELEIDCQNVAGIIKSLRAKLIERKVPLWIIDLDGGYRLQWRQK